MPDGVPLIDPDIVAGRVAALLKERRHGAARPLLAALEKLAPEHQDLVALRVSYCCQIGDVAEALKLLAAAIVRAPGNPALYLQRAEIRFGRADYPGAAADAAEAVLADQALTRAKSVLGLALLKLQQFDSALPCLAESFAADPAGVDVALALAALAPENAIEILERAIAATPRLGVLRNALTRRFICAGDMAKALRKAEETRADGLADAETCCLLAFAQMQQGHWDAAGGSVSQALSMAPGNQWAARLAAALAGRTAGVLSPVLQQDGLAAERALLAGGTILPGTFRALLEDARCRGPVLDLFCGTGLNAVAAQDISTGPWTGIEPDPVLAKICGDTGLYARVEQCSPLDFLARGTQYSVILLNEALGYAAAFQGWFAALRAGLAPGGIALAAIPGGSGLTGHGLFAHDMVRVAEQARRGGFVCSVERSGILRHIEGIPLHGAIIRLQWQ